MGSRGMFRGREGPSGGLKGSMGTSREPNAIRPWGLFDGFSDYSCNIIGID